MAGPCTICLHPDRDAIDHALVAGESVRSIGERFRTEAGALGRMAVQRHKDNHLPATLARAHDAAEVAHADDLLAQLRTLQARTLALLDRAESDGKLGTAVLAIGQARQNLELLAKLLGELDERPQVSLVLSPEWLNVRSALLLALAPYPDARAAVAGQLVALESAGGHRG